MQWGKFDKQGGKESEKNKNKKKERAP